MEFVVHYTVRGEYSQIQQTYPRHRAYLDDFAASGELLQLGTFADPLSQGAMGIFTTRQAAERFIAGDPFVTEGLAEPSEILEWNPLDFRARAAETAAAATHGRVVHFEIPVDNADRANAFYGSVFGWQLQSMPGMGYTLVGTGPTGVTGPTAPGYINGGMLTRQEPISQPILTINVDDIDAALIAVTEAGGSVLRGNQPVGPMGFAAYISDTEGNPIGLWQNA